MGCGRRPSPSPPLGEMPEGQRGECDAGGVRLLLLLPLWGRCPAGRLSHLPLWGRCPKGRGGSAVQEAWFEASSVRLRPSLRRFAPRLSRGERRSRMPSLRRFAPRLSRMGVDHLVIVDFCRCAGVWHSRRRLAVWPHKTSGRDGGGARFARSSFLGARCANAMSSHLLREVPVPMLPSPPLGEMPGGQRGEWGAGGVCLLLPLWGRCPKGRGGSAVREASVSTAALSASLRSASLPRGETWPDAPSLRVVWRSCSIE